MQTLLQRYADLRKSDQKTATWYTDGLNRLFSNDRKALAHARSLGLILLDAMTPGKSIFARRAMGVEGII